MLIAYIIINRKGNPYTNTKGTSYAPIIIFNMIIIDKACKDRFNILQLNKK